MTTTAARSCLNLPAPAKLNLFLHVIGQRPDGKHLLESIFILINLFDTIDLIERFDGQLERTGDIIGAPEKDLCIRAAKALLTAAVDHGKRCCGQLPGATIHVQKRIPAGAGMGGGSSDAATTLIGLNRLWKLGFDRNELAAIGKQLGADIPFFIRGANAFVEGIGERITPIEVPPGRYMVIWPGRSVSTADIFNAPALTRDSESQTIHVFSDLLRNHWPALPGRNDLQSIAAQFEPAVLEALDKLAALGPEFGEPRMTGSGSAVFAPILNGDADASAPELSRLPSGWRGFCVSSLPEHPLKPWSEDAEEENLGV